MDHWKIDDRLKLILGNEAFDNDMQVPKSTEKLCLAVSYQSYQLDMIRKNSDNDDLKDWINRIMIETDNILDLKYNG